jgi:hypothetical protein
MHVRGSHSRRTLLAGGVRLGCAAILAGPLTIVTAATAAARGAGVPARLLASGLGPGRAGGTLVRGCSAVATAVEGAGGSVPSGMALDFRRDLGLLVTGAAPLGMRTDAGTGTVQADSGTAWALVSVPRRGRAGPWRLRIGGLPTSVRVETSHW